MRLLDLQPMTDAQIIEGKAYSWDDWPYFDEVQFAKAYDHFFGPEVSQSQLT